MGPGCDGWEQGVMRGQGAEVWTCSTARNLEKCTGPGPERRWFHPDGTLPYFVFSAAPGEFCSLLQSKSYLYLGVYQDPSEPRERRRGQQDNVKLTLS